VDGGRLIQKAYEAILYQDFEQAMEWFEKAVETEPNNASFHYKLSITYARSNKLDRAIYHARKACELAGHQPQYQYHIQILQAKQLIRQAEKYIGDAEGDAAEPSFMAVALLKQAVALDPLAKEGYLMLGMAYAKLNDFPSALQVIRELLRLDPGHETGTQLLTEWEQKLKTYFQS